MQAPAAFPQSKGARVAVLFNEIIEKAEMLLQSIQSDERSGLMGRSTLRAASEMTQALASFHALAQGSPLVHHARVELSQLNLEDPAQAALAAHVVRLVTVFVDDDGAMAEHGTHELSTILLARLVRHEPLFSGETDGATLGRATDDHDRRLDGLNGQEQLRGEEGLREP